MKKTSLSRVIFVLPFLLCSLTNLVAQDILLEAEQGTSTGLVVSTAQPGYTGTGYLDGWDNNGTDKVIMSTTITTACFYMIKLRYLAASGNKQQKLYINGEEIGNIAFDQTSHWSTAYAGDQYLNEGNNTIEIRTSWGYIQLDNMTISPATPVDYEAVTTSLINPNATVETKAVYDFLRTNYGKYTLAGHTDQYSAELLDSLEDKEFAIKSYDLDSYTQGYAWKWDVANSEHTFGWVDNGNVQKAINWYNQHNGCGILTFQWHWHSPSGGTAGANSFYTSNTTFDISQAILPGTSENTLVIEDIDSIATQLKRLQNAGIPILWRPLHEAGGSWFWWGAKGAEPVKELWDIVYDRLTNHHGLNNLIWVWSTHEESYYPDNSKVDIFGYDSYPNAYDFSSQKGTFSQMYDICDGQKILTLSECGAIPEMTEAYAGDAKWSYFVTWDDLVFIENGSSHVYATYGHEKVLTLEEKCTIASITPDVSELSIFPNPTNHFVHIEGAGENPLWVLYNTFGQLMASGNGRDIDLSGLPASMYVLVVDNTFSHKIIKQ